MILKSFFIEKNLSLIDNYNLIRFYGENIGLNDEFKSSLKRKYNDHEKILFDHHAEFSIMNRGDGENGAEVTITFARSSI